MSYLSASAVVIHYEEALYQVYGPLPLPFTFNVSSSDVMLKTLERSYENLPKSAELICICKITVPSSLFGSPYRTKPIGPILCCHV